MIRKSVLFGLVAAMPVAGLAAQLDQGDRFDILRILIADNAASRISMPLGKDGVRLSESGEIDDDRLREELGDNGSMISPGQIVEITDVGFGSDTIEIELDGGGVVKRGFLDRLEIGVGTTTNPVRQVSDAPPVGSKIVLRFADDLPERLTVDELRDLLSPVLDFNVQSFMDSDVETVPAEFREAVTLKEARIGMDPSTVVMARGRPNGRSWETNAEGIEEEIWIYEKAGFGADFLTFEDGILVRIVRR